MALTITSPSITVVISGNDAIFYATAHGVGGYIYLTYVKGDESALTMKLTYQNKSIGADAFFSHVTLRAGNLSETLYTFSASGNYRIPFVFGQTEKRLKLTFGHVGSTPTGTIGVDIADGGD